MHVGQVYLKTELQCVHPIQARTEIVNCGYGKTRREKFCLPYMTNPKGPSGMCV